MSKGIKKNVGIVIVKKNVRFDKNNTTERY